MGSLSHYVSPALAIFMINLMHKYSHSQMDDANFVIRILYYIASIMINMTNTFCLFLSCFRFVIYLYINYN